MRYHVNDAPEEGPGPVWIEIKIDGRALDDLANGVYWRRPEYINAALDRALLRATTDPFPMECPCE